MVIIRESGALKIKDTIRNIEFEGWVYLLLKPTYQAAEIVRYSNYICHKSIKSDSWESGKVCQVLNPSIFKVTKSQICIST